MRRRFTPTIDALEQKIAMSAGDIGTIDPQGTISVPTVNVTPIGDIPITDLTGSANIIFPPPAKPGDGTSSGGTPIIPPPPVLPGPMYPGDPGSGTSVLNPNTPVDALPTTPQTVMPATPDVGPGSPPPDKPPVVVLPTDPGPGSPPPDKPPVVVDPPPAPAGGLGALNFQDTPIMLGD